MTEFRDIRLPEGLCADTEKWLEGKFDSLESFLVVLLQEITKNDGRKFDEAEQQLVEQRLKDLGYM